MSQLGIVIVSCFIVMNGFNIGQRQSKVEIGTCSWPIIFCSTIYHNASTFTCKSSTTQNLFQVLIQAFSPIHFLEEVA